MLYLAFRAELKGMASKPEGVHEFFIANAMQIDDKIRLRWNMCNREEGGAGMDQFPGNGGGVIGPAAVEH